MVDRRNYDKLVKIEAETLFENFLIKYNYTNTLNAFKEESKILSARSRDSEIVRKFSYDQLEDIIKNTALLENTDKIYLYHTCRSFIDSLCDSARNLKTFLQQNSVLSLSRINSTGNDSPVSLTQPLGSADNNEGAFRYLNQPAIYNGTQGNNNFIKYEHQFGANNFSPSIQCSQNVIYPNSTTFPAYSNGPNNYYNYHQNNRIHSHYGNESSYVGRSDSAGERSDNSIGRSIGHNGNMNGYSSNFLPNGSSTPRTGVNGYGECTSNQESYLTSQRYSTPVQRYHINGPSEYSNNKSYIFQDNTQVNNGTFAPDSMSSSGSIQSQVNGVSYVESKEKSNLKQPRGSNSASKGVKQRKAKNPKDVTTKSTTAAKRRNNSNDVDEATKVPKLDNNVDQGVLNFQTPLNFSHFGKAAKDVDLEKEPYLAKSYSSNISNDSRNVGLSNVQNIVGKIDQYKQFNENCNKGNKNAYKLMNNKSSSCSVITGPILKKSGSKNSTAKLDDTYESTTQYTSFKEKPLTESTIMNCDNGDSNMVSHDSCNDVTNYFADINTGGSDVQDLAQELILDGESDFVFGMDTSILTDPGRTFDLFDEIGKFMTLLTKFLHQSKFVIRGTFQIRRFCSLNNMHDDTIDIGFNLSTSLSTQHSFLVVHPKIRWGQNVSPPDERNDELQLEEAISLVKTIPGFSVSQSVIVGTDYTTKKKQIWGQGRIDSLIKIKAALRVSAIMVNVEMLTPLQQTTLFEIFQVPIYDRYNIVLAIFKHFAKTKLAHYQIQLAELPYIKHRLHYLESNKVNGDILHVGDVTRALSKTGLDRKELLRLREQVLRKRIKDSIESTKHGIEEQRIRYEKKNVNTPLTVAVVGYTNVGKTNLIKTLTGSSQLQPENKLFATLDTTIHPLVLPSKSNIFIADTIGFISSLPVGLFESFSATLMHATSANLLIHVFDLSHPDVFAQKKNVMKTLIEMKFPSKLIENMIHVGNKIDIISEEKKDELYKSGILSENDLVISSKTGYGVNELILKIDKCVMKINNSHIRRFKLKPESKIVSYLYENGLVTSEPVVSECGKYLIYDTCLNENQFNKLKKRMGSIKKKQ